MLLPAPARPSPPLSLTPSLAASPSKRLRLPTPHPPAQTAAVPLFAVAARRSHTPRNCGRFFCKKIPNFKVGVFVGAIPTQVGIPVHCKTRCRSSRPKSSRSRDRNSVGLRETSRRSIRFYSRNHCRQSIHDSAADVSVQSVIRAEDANILALYQLPDFELRITHLDTKLPSPRSTATLRTHHCLRAQ